MKRLLWALAVLLSCSFNGWAARPIIAIQPQNVVVAPDASFALWAYAYGDEPLTFQWKLNGTDLPGENSSILELQASESSAGVYTLDVSNADGSALSAPATVTVSSHAKGGAAWLTGRSISLYPTLTYDGY